MATGGVVVYLDVADSLGERRGDQHGRRGDGASHEEDGPQLALGQAELAAEKVGYPGQRRREAEREGGREGGGVRERNGLEGREGKGGAKGGAS